MAIGANWFGAITSLTDGLEDHFGKKELADRVRMHQKDIASIRRGTASITTATAFVDRAGVSFDAILDGRPVCLHASIAHLRGAKDYAPAWYLNGLSKRDISARMLKFVGDQFDQSIPDCVMKYFQIGSDFYGGSDNVSTFLNRDILKHLKRKHGFSMSVLGRGAMRLLQSRKDIEGKNLKEMFENYINGFVENNIEQSYKYKIMRITGDEMIAEARPSEKLVELHKGIIPHSAEECEYLLAFTGTIPYQRFGYYADTIEEKCIGRGDDYCRYVLRY